jgi:transcriptional regulator with XRE-family HTH domain
MIDFMDDFGGAVKTARKSMGMSRSELAKKVNVTSRHMGAIENNLRRPGFDALGRLVRVLALPPTLIFYPENPEKAQKLCEIFELLRRCSDHEIDAIIAKLKSLVEQ